LFKDTTAIKSRITRKPDVVDISGKMPSPIMRQYGELMEQYPGHVILIQVGDFYEIFGEQAERVALLLEMGITRSMKKYGQAAMTGFPVRALDNYLERLVKLGERLVLCQQFELRPGVFERRVTRVVTRGTLTEEGLLEGQRNNYLASISKIEDQVGVAWLDLSTGAFRCTELEGNNLLDCLTRIGPAEIVADESVLGHIADYLRHHQVTFTPFSSIFRQSEKELSEVESRACQIIECYLEKTQLEQKPYFEEPKRYLGNEVLMLDAAAVKSLELIKTNATGNKENSLLSTIDLTLTSAGARLLTERIRKNVSLTDPISKSIDKHCPD